jgi:geranylgeranyl diphosphate synthase type II
MKDYTAKYNSYREEANKVIDSLTLKSEPSGLYIPVKYILSGGGKRLRPVLLLFTCEAFGGNYKDALFAAASIELLHNFTLVHDDIMDNADTRRGRETIHKKWDRDTAILAGDHLIALSLKALNMTETLYLKRVYDFYINSLSEVCEGQIYDKAFEKQKNITIENYLMMCRKKTSKLLESCTAIGAVIAGAGESDIQYAVSYAENLGLAFQIQDDLLDIMGEEKKFGKKQGGDIREGKKTYMLLKAIELAEDEEDKKILNHIVNKEKIITEDGFTEIAKKIYIKYGVAEAANKAVEKFTVKADTALMNMKSAEGRDLLTWFSKMILNRNF